MPLSVRQRAALAVILKLAGDAELPGAGQTIAQQAAAGAGAAAGAHAGGHQAPKKVASALGAAHYKLPIGALIIPHQHFIKGEPSHWAGHISQAKWVANQWKSRPDADDAAHKAVEAGTHRWVQAGEHEFAVHKGVEVHVPKGTDLNNPAEVKNAPKVFVKKNEHGEPAEHLTIHPNHVDESAPQATTPADKATLGTYWKPLHQPDKPVKAVSFAGKHAGWVPHDWQVYKSAHTPEEELGGKYAKDPDGNWHHIATDGKLTPAKQPHDDWVKNGDLVADDDHPADHGIVPHGEGAQPATVDVGGVAVTREHLKEAIAKLQGSKSTQIKGLLKGHPLEAADYHSVYKGELAKHPHLKVPPGTKKAHVPEAKNAFIHHLARKLRSLSSSQGGAAAAEAVQDKAAAAADHAQQLTPHQVTLPHENAPTVQVEVGGKVVGEAPPGSKVYVWHKVAQTAGRAGPKYVQFPDGTWHYFTAEGKTVNPDLKMDEDLANGNLIPLDQVSKPSQPFKLKTGQQVKFIDTGPAPEPEEAAPGPAGTAEVTGITVTKEDIQAAIDALNASKSTAIKQVLKAKGNKLADADYWAVIHAWEAAHPVTSKAKGTKQQHVGNAKTMFIAALQEKLDGLAKADAATGHDKAAELYALAKDGTLKPNAQHDVTVTSALASAAHLAAKEELTHYVWKSAPGSWVVSPIKPSKVVYYKVTPELKASVFHEGDEAGIPTLLWNAVHLWIEPKKEEPAAPAAEEPGPLASTSPELATVLNAFKQDAAETKAWTENPDWPQMHQHVIALTNSSSQLYALKDAQNNKQRFASLLVQVYTMGKTRYLVKEGHDYKTLPIPPTIGTYGAKGTQYWEIRPDHQIIFHDLFGNHHQLGMSMVQEFLSEGIKQPNQLVEDVTPLSVGPYTYQPVEGDAVFKAGTTSYYIRHADGTWTLVDKWDGVLAISPGNYKTLESWASGDGNVSLEAWNEEAKKFAASVKPVPKPEPKAPEPDVQVFIQGVKAASFPAGSKVYGITTGNNSVKYVKTPDGQWHYVFAKETKPGSNWDNVIPGGSGYEEIRYGSNGLPKEPKPKPKAPTAASILQQLDKKMEAQAAATSGGIPAIYKGQIVGEYPAGSKLYHKSVGSYQGTYAKAPDGKWYYATGSGVKEAASYQVSDKLLEQEHALEPEEPPTAEKLANVQAATELAQLAKNGSADPAKALNKGSWDYYGPSPAFKTWQHAMVAELTRKKGGNDVTVMAAPPALGGFRAAYPSTGQEEHWTFYPSQALVKHFPGGDAKPVEIPVSQLLEAGKRYIVPNAVVVNGKLHRVGWWKKPKGTAYLEIKNNNGYANVYKHGSAAYGEYFYHGADGSVKEVTPAFAAKYLDGAEHFADEPKPQPKLPKSSPMAVSHATAAVPGIYNLYSHNNGGGPHPKDSIDLKPDGSGVYNSDSGPAEVPAKTMDAMLGGGMILDAYGNTVVRPGTSVQHYHLFGGAAKTKEDLQAFKAWLEANWNGGLASWAGELAKVLYDEEHQGADFQVYEHKDLIKAFIGDKAADPTTGNGQRDAVYQLVKELLAIPELPEGAKLASAEEAAQPKEVAYLKTMPPGIKQAADVFTFVQDGNAVPYQGEIPLHPDTLTVPELKEAIAKISQQFGDGKVVGTHLTMPKYSLVDWLTSWKKGDMQAVFELDAAAGKVSPAHPGAPASKSTHHITWSAADPNQVPAAKDISGAWSDLKYGNVPIAEADNYLLAMHFQHAEHLTASERQVVVKAHRTHDQDKVDKYTVIASQRFEAGATPYSGPLEWTDGLKPAHPYDAFLQNQTPATDWSIEASKAFVESHQAELAPYAAEVGTEHGYSAEHVLNPDSGYWIHEKVIQKWLDDAHAKEIAAQMVPVWKKVDTGQLPSHGHEVWKATKTVPYTGEKTTWFVKPAPDGKVFRIEQEHAANMLGKLFGFKTAESQLLDPSVFGQVVQAQKAVSGSPLGYYTDMPAWDSFTPQEIADIAMEHALDIVLFNDDTSANNMIRTPDGHLVGIDKGRSWGDMDWQGLAGNSRMDSMTQLVYTKLYDAIRSGAISKDVADQAYIAVIQKARKMQAVPDSAVRKILEDGFAHRTKFGEGGKEALIQKVLDQKNSLEHDLHKMWAKVYQEAGFGAQSGDFGKGMPWGEAPASNARWGIVAFNEHGQVLLREAKGHYGGAAWTFSKGGANPGESPMQAAVRESAEEVKYQFNPVGYVPGAFEGKASTTYYYLASAKGAKFTPELDNGETEQTKWVSVEEARQLIQHGGSEDKVAQRDLAVLEAAVKAWGTGMYEAQPLSEVQGLGSPLPLVPQAKLPAAPGGHTLYAGFSEQGLLDHAMAAKGNGIPAFFGGPELRDMHVLVYRHKDQAGQDVTMGETFLKDGGYAKVVQWLKSHTGKEHDASMPDTKTTYEGTEGLPGQAPASSPDRGGFSGERDFYNKIIKAARTVSRHKADGKYNADALAGMEQARKDLEKLAEGADAVLNKPDAKDIGGLFEQMQGLKDMATHYLDLIGQVQKAKDGSYGFAQGDLPRWLPKVTAKPEEKPEDELAKLGYKVTYGSTDTVPKGTFNGDTHQFEQGSGTVEYSGKWWTLTLPDGEKIVVGNGNEHGVQQVHHGRLRFTTPEHSAASLERIRAAMQYMGLDMHEAEARDFETFYWRHLLAMLDDRADGHKGKQQQVWDELKAQFAKNGLPWGYGTGDDKHGDIIAALQQLGESNPQAETDAYRHAFAKLTSEEQVADWAERGGFLPHLKHFDPNNPSLVGGKPDWYRFDVAPLVPTLPMPLRQTGHADRVARDTVKNGGSFGLDALRRMFGFGTSTKGNPDDTGGPAYVFTRINVSGGQTMFTPLALARTHNYSFSDDSFGRWEYRKHGGDGGGGSPWAPETWSKYSGSVNETMISDALSFLDDVELLQAYNAAQRQELINWLKDRGITHIRFMPVEDRIVLNIDSAAREKVRANWKAHPELLDPLAEPHLYGEQGPAQASPQEVPPQLKAESAALDTPPAATAAEEGKTSYQFPAGGTVDLPGSWQVYQSGEMGGSPHPSDAAKLWAKDSAGHWWFVQQDHSPVEASPNNAASHDASLEDGTYVPAQQASASGEPGQGNYTFKNGEPATLPSDWTVYKSTDAGYDMNKLWASDPNGQWWFVQQGSAPKKLAPEQAAANELNVGSIFVPADKADVLPPSGGTAGGWTEQGGHSQQSWLSGNGQFKIVKNSAGTFALYQNDGYGWDDPAYVGSYDTLAQAQGAAENPEPPF